MTIGRIGGPMLKENLIRQGVDLSVETNLLYLDVNNMRIGVNTATPNVALDINGITRFSSSLQINGSNITTYASNGNITLTPHGTGKVAVPYLTDTRVLLVGPGGTLIDSPNLTFDGTTLSVGSLGLGNLSVTGNTLTSINSNGDIILDPNGTGKVIVDTNTIAANRVFYSGSNNEITTTSNFSFDGSNLVLLGTATITTLDVATLGSDAINGNINLNPNGTGNVLLDTATANRVIFSGTNKELLTDNNLQFDGTTIQIGNIAIANNTISSTSGNINIAPAGTNRVVFESTNAMRLPIGDTSQRPTPVEGDFRYNNETKLLEYYNSTDWNTLTVDIIYNISEAFNGDGSTSVFTLSQPASSDGAFIALNGVLQSPGLAYGISGYTLTFTEAPAAGDRIDIRYITLANELSLTSIADVNTNITVDDTVELANVNINGSLQLQVSSSTTKINNNFATTAPVTKTADFTLATGENFVIVNKVGSSCIVTLPTPATNAGRQVTFKTLQTQALVSASSNVAPLDSATPGTAILTNTVGKWATLVSDGTNWIIMAAN